MKTSGQPQELQGNDFAGTGMNQRADRADISARFARSGERLPHLRDAFHQDRRAESLLYAVLGVGVLVAIASHYFGDGPATRQLEVALRECLRFVGLC